MNSTRKIYNVELLFRLRLDFLPISCMGGECAVHTMGPLQQTGGIERTHRKVHPVNATNFDLFLSEATTQSLDDPNSIGRDRLYGLYLSWCNVHGITPRPERAFWLGMKTRGHSGNNKGLRMRGPAALDYFLTSRSALS